MSLSSRNFYKLNIVLNGILLLIAIFLSYAHFKPSLTEFCAINAQWDCDIVNKSIYAELFGIPVAILGTAVYAFFLGFSVRALYRNQERWLKAVFAALTGALLFALYLTGIEAFVLKTYCIFCVAQQILVLLEWTLWAYFLNQSSPPLPPKPPLS